VKIRLFSGRTEPPSGASPIATPAQQVAADGATRVIGATVLVCLALGPIGAWIGTLAYGRSGAAAVSVDPVVDRSGERAAAGEYAQRVVTAWLVATRDDAGELAALVPGVPTASLAREPFVVADPAVAGIEEIAAGVWSVTVAATVTDARQVTARRYFQVPVTVSGDVVTALMMPTPVNGPVPGLEAAGGYGSNVEVTSPLGQAVSGFLGAYLTGASDVSRWTTPGTVLAALDPAPYAGLSLDTLRSAQQLDATAAPVDGQTARLLATATASVTDDQSAPVAYALTMTARAGRWETTAIDAVPVLAITPNTTPSPAAPTGTAATP